MNNVRFDKSLGISSTISPVSHASGVESAPSSTLKPLSFVGVPHKAVLPIPQEAAFVDRFSSNTTEGDGGGYMQISVDKVVGIDPVEQIINASAMALTLLQTLDPSLKFLNTVEGSPLPPITSPDKTAGFPTSTMILFIYFMMDRKWTLTNPAKTAEEMKIPKREASIRTISISERRFIVHCI